MQPCDKNYFPLLKSLKFKELRFETFFRPFDEFHTKPYMFGMTNESLYSPHEIVSMDKIWLTPEMPKWGTVHLSKGRGFLTKGAKK